MATAALLSYRTHCAASSAPGQLILPEALKLLPLYVSCITRLPAFAQNKAGAGGKGSSGVGLGGAGTIGQTPGAPFYDTAMRSDRRAAEFYSLSSLPVHRILSELYSRVYRVDEACMRGSERRGGEGGGQGEGEEGDSEDDGSGTPGGGLEAEEEEEEEEGVVGLGYGSSGGSGGGSGSGSGGSPRAARLPAPGTPLPLPLLQALTRIHLPSHAPSGATYYPSIELLSEEGAYLIETAHRLYLWVGPGVSEAWVGAVFGRAVAPGQLPLGLALPRLGGSSGQQQPPSAALRRLWGYVRGISARRCLGGTSSGGELPLSVVVPGDGAGREEVGYALLEDRLPGSGPVAQSSSAVCLPSNARSYVEVLCAIHSSITASLSAHT